MEYAKPLMRDANKVCQCPHCKRLISAPPEALQDPLFFTKSGAQRGWSYTLPPFLNDVVGGIGALSAGMVFAWYNAGTMMKWAERTLPQTRVRNVLLPLVAFTPLALGGAVVAGIGRGLLPAFVELTMRAYSVPAEAAQGMVDDVKKRDLVARLKGDNNS